MIKNSRDTCSKEYTAEPAVQNTVKELQVARACYFNNNQNFNANDRNINNYNSAVRGIALNIAGIFLIMYRDLWEELCSYENLFLAYKKARKHKTTKDYVIEFEKALKHNLLMLHSELLLHCYTPKPLVDFIVKDPKTRKISKSDFRDRIVHHALCNVIEPIFDKAFIYDSYANRIGKGTLKAIGRFDFFKRKASRNNTVKCYILKADIKKYFENVDHNTLLEIIEKKITDKNVLWLIQKILSNISTGIIRKGMPLGNLTSQFFANVYLNELDYFVKHRFKIKYYIRYVDDFIIFEQDRHKLKVYQQVINKFLNEKLKIMLPPDKSKIFVLGNSLSFLGFRVFYHHKLLKKPNIRKMKHKLLVLMQRCNSDEINYDLIYDSLEGWIAYVKNANTYKLRKKITAKFEKEFSNEISTKEINKYLKMQKKDYYASNTNN